MNDKSKIFSHSHITGKVSVCVDDLIEKMNNGETLRIPWESNVTKKIPNPIVISSYYYESPNDAFESDELKSRWIGVDDMQRRAYDSQILSYSLVDKIMTCGTGYLADYFDEIPEGMPIGFAVIADSINFCTFWINQYEGANFEMKFDPEDEYIIAALNYAFNGDVPKFEMLNPRYYLNDFQPESNGKFVLLFNYKMGQSDKFILNIVLARILS